MNKKIVLYVALMAVSLYAIPNTVSLFAGQHTFYGGMGVQCGRCHSDVLAQLQTGNSYEKHRDAAGNFNYTTYLSLGGTGFSNGNITDYKGFNWTWNGNLWVNSSNMSETKKVSLDTGGSAGIDGDEICMMCHNATLFGTVTHTGIVVRACDDDRCHGNRNGSYNRPELFGKTSSGVAAAGYYLSRSNIHQPFYIDASDQPSRYGAGFEFGPPGNANGTFTSRGHWTCEGCHSGIDVNATINPAPVFDHSVTDAQGRYN